MTRTPPVVEKVTCDGCGQGADSGHIARRLARLEQTTRYRPIHIQAVFLSARSPQKQDAFLYGAEKGFEGEAAALLDALQIDYQGRAAEAVLSEFQRKGFLLTHVLECAADSERDSPDMTPALKEKLPSVLRRLRASLKPKRVVVVSKELGAVSGELKAAGVGAEVVLDGDAPFDLGDAGSIKRLRLAL